MALKKNLAVVSLLAIFAVPAFSYADTDPSVLKADVTDAIARLIARYESRIAALEAENAQLKSQLSGSKPANAVTAPASGGLTLSPLDDEAPVKTPSVPAKTPAATVKPTSSSSTGNAEYDAVIRAVTAQFSDILKENGLPSDSELGLFEFIPEKRAFFISIDDGKNPAGVTAFKTKMLFHYDSGYKTSVAGVFDLNYDVQKYKTLFGSNPYSSSSRVRVKNPSYKGKLLDDVPTTAPAATAPTTNAGTAAPTTTTAPSTAVVSADVTAKSVRAAYDKNKLADAIKLANAYLAKNPNDVEILTIRYRSLYITGKYADSLKDVQSIETIQGSKFDCTIAKDAAFIAKSAKNAELATKYAAMCKR
ncbi:MAG: hypothetical protein QG650_1094 [Patescibacteria group bacterium]|nr:hypothetical protein [Patescibacteria group bacterium]